MNNAADASFIRYSKWYSMVVGIHSILFRVLNSVLVVFHVLRTDFHLSQSTRFGNPIHRLYSSCFLFRCPRRRSTHTSVSECVRCVCLTWKKKNKMSQRQHHTKQTVHFFKYSLVSTNDAYEMAYVRLWLLYVDRTSVARSTKWMTTNNNNNKSRQKNCTYSY